MPKKDYSDLQMRFGENLKRIRITKELSLRSMATKCDIDDSSISKIENGRLNVQLSTIIELAKGLNIHPKELFDFIDPD